MEVERADWIKACEKTAEYLVMRALIIHLKHLVPGFSADELSNICLDLIEDLKESRGASESISDDVRDAGYEAARFTILSMIDRSDAD